MGLFSKKPSEPAPLPPPLPAPPADLFDAEQAALAHLEKYGAVGDPYTLDKYRESQRIAAHFFPQHEDRALVARTNAQVLIALLQTGQLTFDLVDEVMGLKQAQLQAAGIRRGDWLLTAALTDEVKQYMLALSNGGPLAAKVEHDPATSSEILGTELVIQLRLRARGVAI